MPRNFQKGVEFSHHLKAKNIPYIAFKPHKTEQLYTIADRVIKECKNGNYINIAPISKAYRTHLIKIEEAFYIDPDFTTIINDAGINFEILY